MSNHTPGPWELSEAIYEDGCGTYRRIEQVKQFGDVVGSVCIRHAINNTLNEAGEANARLIAAAPELFDALLDALSVTLSVSTSRDRRILRDGCTLYAQTDEWCNWVENEVAPKISAAIAKVTGETT